MTTVAIRYLEVYFAEFLSEEKGWVRFDPMLDGMLLEGDCPHDAARQWIEGDDLLDEGPLNSFWVKGRWKELNEEEYEEELRMERQLEKQSKEVEMGNKVYIFEVWNVAGLEQGAKFKLSVPAGKRPYYDVLLPMLEEEDVECWHIDYVHREVGQYRGNLAAIQRQMEEEKEVGWLQLTPGARYRTVADWYEEDSEYSEEDSDE